MQCSSKCTLGFLCNLSFSRHFHRFLFHDIYQSLDERFNLLIHVRKLFNCRVSVRILFSMCQFLRKNFEYSCDQVTFKMPLSNKITLTVTEVVLIQGFFLTNGSKQKIPWYHHIIQR